MGYGGHIKSGKGTSRKTPIAIQEFKGHYNSPCGGISHSLGTKFWQKFDKGIFRTRSGPGELFPTANQSVDRKVAIVLGESQALHRMLDTDFCENLIIGLICGRCRDRVFSLFSPNLPICGRLLSFMAWCLHAFLRWGPGTFIWYLGWYNYNIYQILKSLNKYISQTLTFKGQ